MKTEVKNRLCRIRLEKLKPDEPVVTHKLVFRRRKGAFQLHMPMAGGEARRNHKEGKWCYWITITCPTDKIKRGDLVLNVSTQTTFHVALDSSENYINILNNNEDMEKVIASRNDAHHRLQISDEDVRQYIEGKITNRIQVKYEVKSWEEECLICKGSGHYPKFPEFKCKCKNGMVTKSLTKPIYTDVIQIDEHQTIFTRQELIDKLHESLDANVTAQPPFRKLFTEQLNKWIEKTL